MKRRFKLNKLIRDKLPDILYKRGIEICQQALSEEEYVACLKDKLLEEVRETLEAKTKIEICEELADILEVIEALSVVLDLPLKKVKAEKRAAKGGFENRIYVDFIDVDSNDPDIDYYLAKANQYPEVCDE